MVKKIEIFTDGSSSSDRLLVKVKELACSKCEIVVYEQNDQRPNKEIEDKVNAYGINSFPAVVLGGKLVDPVKLHKAKIG